MTIEELKFMLENHNFKYEESENIEVFRSGKYAAEKIRQACELLGREAFDLYALYKKNYTSCL